jgi:hypothetical protein
MELHDIFFQDFNKSKTEKKPVKWSIWQWNIYVVEPPKSKVVKQRGFNVMKRTEEEAKTIEIILLGDDPSCLDANIYCIYDAYYNGAGKDRKKPLAKKKDDIIMAVLENKLSIRWEKSIKKLYLGQTTERLDP